MTGTLAPAYRKGGGLIGCVMLGVMGGEVRDEG